MFVLKCFVFSLLFLIPPAILRQDLASGLRAYERGDYTRALKELRPLAEKGDSSAQLMLGAMYTNAQGVPEDFSEAAKWYRMAAEQGDPLGQVALGLMYAQGKGVAEDYKESIKWFRLAAEEGNPEAQYILGSAYNDGEGVAEDHKEAAKWYHMAAEQGLGGAQHSLGVMYAKGEGVVQDYRESIKWFRLAAEQGQAESQFALGQGYTLGRGVPEDFSEAAKWYRMAAERGHTRAQAGLGTAYFVGKGVPQDYVLGHMWLNLSATSGDASALKLRDMVPKIMTREQIAEAQRLAREWKPKTRSTDQRERPDLQQALAAPPPAASQDGTGCLELQPVWRQGLEVKRVSCGGVTIGVGAAPAFGGNLPLGYGVIVWNQSADTVEVDWEQCRLEWTTKRSERQVYLALDPDRVKSAAHWEGAHYGLSVDAGPYLQRTTLPTGGRVFGFVYFRKPRVQTCELLVDIPRKPTFRFTVSATPK